MKSVIRIVAGFFVGTLLLFVPVMAASAASTFTPQTTFAASDRPEALVFSPDGTKAFIASSTTNTCKVYVVNVATQTQVAEVSVCSSGNIHDIQITPDGSSVWVTVGTEVKAINTGTYAVTNPIPTYPANFEPFGFAFSGDGIYAYFSDTHTAIHKAYRFLVATGALDHTYDWGASNEPLQTDDVAISPDGTRAFFYYSTSGKGIFYNLTNSTSSNFSAGGQDIWDAHFTANSSQLFIATNFSRAVEVFDRSFGAVATIQLPHTATSLALSPDGTTFVSSQGSSSFAVIDVATRAFQEISLTSYSGGFLSAFSPSGSLVYLGNLLNANIQPISISPGLVTPASATPNALNVTGVVGTAITPANPPVTTGLFGVVSYAPCWSLC